MKPLLALVLTLAFYITLIPTAHAQIGLHPPKVDWRKLTSPEANILYPAGYEVRAQRIANLMHAMRTKHNATVGDKHYRFDLVLQTPNTTINGYVGLAPFRSEFYLTPPQQPNLLSNTDWADLLAIHEFRHVQQTSNERRGITKLFSILFGQLGWAGASNLATPNWYSEGDAVIMETALTEAGRGRTPAFSSTLRSLERAGRRYRYGQARNNSFRRLIPDHYRYGYNTITYARAGFGQEVWTDVLQRGAAYRGLVYPFSRNLKRATGLNTRGMYRAALDDLSTRQVEDLGARGPFVAGEPIGKDHRAVTDYRYPGFDAKGRLLALKSGFVDTPVLVVVDPTTGRETEVTPVGIQREPYVDVRGRFVTWMENRNDPRYQNEGYSDVIFYELASGRSRRLSHRRRYLSPALSFRGDQIVAVEEDVLNDRLNLVVIATTSGEALRSIPITATGAALPKFSPDGSTVYYYERGPAGTSIVALDLQNETRRTLLPATFEPLGNLQVAENGTLIYGSGRDGIDNAYQLDPATGQVAQLTNVPIGAEYPALGPDGALYYTEATPGGQRLRRMETGNTGGGLLPGLAGGVRPKAPNVFERPESWSDEVANLPADVPREEYPSRDVSDNLYGIRLHSWNAVGDVVTPGIGVAASNALNTITLDATARYNFNEERPVFAFGASYGGLYPVLSASLAYSGRNYFSLIDQDTALVARRQSFNQVAVTASATVPYAWTAGEFNFNFQPLLSLTRFTMGDRVGEVPDAFNSARGLVQFIALRRRARSQVQSRMGIGLRLDYRNTIGEAGLGQLFRLDSRVWLPGLFKTHSFRINFGYQVENALNLYQYIDGFQYARGYDVDLADNVWRVQLDYELPVVYPEFNVLGIYYLSRVRLNGFGDYGRYNVTRLPTQTMLSTGFELFLDQTLFNTIDTSIGLRGSYLLREDVLGNGSNSANFMWETVFSQQF